MHKTYPATSLTTSRTKAVRLLRWPLVRETRGLTTRGVVFYITAKKDNMSASIVCFGNSDHLAEDEGRAEQRSSTR
jgi:hypothetical protein